MYLKSISFVLPDLLRLTSGRRLPAGHRGHQIGTAMPSPYTLYLPQAVSLPQYQKSTDEPVYMIQVANRNSGYELQCRATGTLAMNCMQ